MKAAALALALLLAASAAAQAEIVKEGNLVVTVDGGISPRALPRDDYAPVTVGVEATFRTTDGADPPPQLRRISFAINRGGRLFDRGLPTCRVRRIQPSTIAAARRLCGGAIVGDGNLRVRVRLQNQPAFTFKGKMLVFNAERRGGKRRLLAQVYGRKPPSAFVLTFRVRQRSGGAFGTVIETTLPRSARDWAYVTHFAMKLRRTYRFRGRQRSFVSARCAAPAGFPGAVFPFARAEFGFADGRSVASTLVRDCTVR